jgi:MYXO-CTERM domain-containing protein
MLEVMGNDYLGVYSGLLYSEINTEKEPNQSSMAEGGGSGSMTPLLLLALALLRRIRLRH